jgi:hypothetical protein
MHVHYMIVTAFLVSCATTEPGDPIEPAPPTTTATDLPTTLDREMIEAGIEPVRASVLDCRNLQAETGIVTMLITVAPDGQVVDSHAVRSTRDRSPLDASALGECAARMLTSAKFAATRQGGSFSFPFRASDFAN